jgi:hypothetical protein
MRYGALLIHLHWVRICDWTLMRDGVAARHEDRRVSRLAKHDIRCQLLSKKDDNAQCTLEDALAANRYCCVGTDFR